MNNKSYKVAEYLISKYDLLNSFTFNLIIDCYRCVIIKDCYECGYFNLANIIMLKYGSKHIDDYIVNSIQKISCSRINFQNKSNNYCNIMFVIQD